MRKAIILITVVLTIFVVGCQTGIQIQEDQVETLKTEPSEFGFNAFCFYKMDEKYSTEKDSLKIQQWMKDRSELLLTNDSFKNIFSSSGGGPNFAEWNPSTDLYIAVRHPKTQPIHLTLNQKLPASDSFEFNEQLMWYKVQRSFWEKEARSIDSTDIPLLYVDTFLKEVELGIAHPLVGLDYGEVIRFDIWSGDKHIIEYFHAAYGE